ncbi:ankyrin repeat domain-containing protein [Paenibacillus apiarius]|uniref:ankyrin repeat domain-containing protein n=1 Tax=Paenibacillus apiarius TaxID=46240 RepID=UPI003B3A4427
MKKFVTKTPAFLLGLLVGAILTAGTAVGAATFYKAMPMNITVVVGENQAKLSDSPLNVNGKTYLPLRDTASALGYSVQSVTSSEITLKEKANVDKEKVQKNTAKNDKTKTTIKTVKMKNLKETYSADGKLDAAKLKEALNDGTLDVNAQDADTGMTLMHYVVLEDNYEAYKAIRRNNLNVNIPDNNGQTPLFLAVINKNHFYFGEVLDELNADFMVKDSGGKQAIDYTDKGTTFYNALRFKML